jgi:uncharacterized protein YndB with AHSA1/START domain
MHDFDELGVLVLAGDDWKLTFTRRLKHPPEKVWRAVTAPEHLVAWFPDGITGEWRVGAKLRFGTPGGDGFDGEVLVFDPPTTVEFTWGTDRLRIDVRPDDDGTLLTMTDTFGELGKAARDGAGWHECLERLGADVEGAALPKWGEGWMERFERYRKALGPEASTIGPPEGWQPEA